MVRRAGAVVSVLLLAALLVGWAEPPSGVERADPPTIPTTTSSSLPCIEVTSTNPPAYVLICPPL
jgi:hypothetical protein